MKVGRKPNLERKAIVERFDIGVQNKRRKLPRKFMDQLDACASDVERRLLLGKSQREVA